MNTNRHQIGANEREPGRRLTTQTKKATLPPARTARLGQSNDSSMTAHRKKLIEVALPLEAINKASAKEKSIRHGHPSTLHLWWARRPLAACRAVLFASLVDDPDSDPMFGGSEDIAASKRAELFNLIEELVLWENSNNPRVINRAGRKSPVASPRRRSKRAFQKG